MLIQTSNIPPGIESQFAAGDMGNNVTDFLRRSEYSKRTRDARARLHEDYYNGDQHFYFDPNFVAIRSSEYIFRGIVLNFSSGVIDTAQSTMMQVNLFPEAVARSGDPWDARSADALTRVCQDHDYRNKTNTIRRRLAHDILVDGDVFVRISYDENELGTICLTPEEAVQLGKMTNTYPKEYSKMPDGRLRCVWPLGGTTEHIVSANLVFMEPGCRNFREAQEFIVVDYPSVARAKAMFPDAAEVIKPMNIRNVRSAEYFGRYYTPAMTRYNDMLGDMFNELAQMCWIVEYWQKEGSTWHRRVFTGPNCRYMIRDEDSWPSHLYVHYGCKPTNKFWHKSMMRDMEKIQYAINVLSTQQMDFFVKTVKNVIMMPRGSNTSPLSNDFNLIVEFDPSGGAPQFRPMDSSVLNIIEQLKRTYIADLQRLGQTSEAAQGEIQARMPAKAIQEARDAISNPLLDIRDRMRESEAEKYRYIGLLAQQFYSIGRLGSLMGKYGDVAVKEFSSADLMSGTDVQMIDTDETARSKDKRMDFAIQVAKTGFWMPESDPWRKAVFEYIDKGTIGSMKGEEEQIAEYQAMKEHQAIIAGQVELSPPQMVVNVLEDTSPIGRLPKLVYSDTRYPLFETSQNHPVHIDLHMKALNDVDSPPMARQMVKYHIDNEHQAFVQVQQQAQLQQELENIKQASIAKAAGTVVATVEGAKASAKYDGGESGERDKKKVEVKGSPSSGGVKSGETRKE